MDRFVFIAGIAILLLMITHQGKPKQSRFPPLTKAHRRVYYPNIVPYEKFRARRLLQESQSPRAM